MKRKIKVGVIGAGRIGLYLESDKKRIKPATHFGMWLANKKTNLEYICDKNKNSYHYAKKLAPKIKYFKDHRKLLLEKPDIISISTWKDTHYKITKDSIYKGIKVIVLEKPIANNIRQAREILSLSKKKRVKIIINHRRRFDREIIKLRKKLESGIIGEILQVSSFYVYGILTTGTHLVDTLRMLLKNICGDIERVSGTFSKKNNFKPKDDVNIDGICFFKNGTKATIQNLDMKSYDNFDIYIYGTKGKILITDIGRKIIKYNVIKSLEHTGFTELNTRGRVISKGFARNQFKLLGENAVNCLLKKKTLPLCGAQDSFVDMVVIDKLIKSSKKNGKFLSIKLKN